MDVPVPAVTKTGSGHTLVTRGLESASYLYHHHADKRAGDIKYALLVDRGLGCGEARRRRVCIGG